MPHALDWTVINDFTPGLITVDDWFVPAQGLKMGAQQMDDCYPSPVGGLRAGIKFSSFTNGGLPTNAVPLGIYTRQRPLRSGTAASGADRYMMVHDNDTDEPKLFRFDGSDDVTPPTQWELLKTFAVTTAGRSLSPFISYTVGGTLHTYTALWSGSDAGLYRIKYSDGSVTQVRTDANIRALTVHQDRIVFATGEAQGTRLRWNDPGTETFQTDSFLDLQESHDRPAVMWAKSYIQDLIVARQGAQFIAVQGDINLDPAVRTLSGARPAGEIQDPAEVPDGLAFIAWRDGLYVTSHGSEVRPLSSAILTTEMSDIDRTNDGSVGAFAFGNHWLFLPNGHIHDVRTGAIFKTTAWDSSGPGKFMAVDEGPRDLIVCTSESPISIFETPLAPGRFNRKDTFTWTSAPLHDPTGRMLMCREVEVYTKAYASGASIVCTVNGVTRTVSSIASGEQKIKFRFREASEVLDVQLTSNSNSGSVEAPSIETVRIGTTPWHRSR